MPNGIPERCRPIQERCDNIRDQIQAIIDELSDPNIDPPLTLGERSQLITDRRQLEGELPRCEAELNRCIAQAPTSNLNIVCRLRTQGIQYFLFNNKGSGREVNNAIDPLLFKTTIFRVYVNLTEEPGLPIPTSITGRISWERPRFDRPTERGEISPINGSIFPRRAAAIDRGDAHHTLNFVLPGSEAFTYGPMRFTVTVFDPAHQGEAAYTSLAFAFDIAGFEFAGTGELQVHAVLVHYAGLGPPDRAGNRQDVDIPRPSRQEFFDALRFTRKVFPIWRIDYTGFTEIDFSGDLFSTPQRGWDELLSEVEALRSSSGTNDIYVGLLSPPVPIREIGGVGSLGGGAAVAVATPDSTTVAHEIGHALGRLHAPCPPSGPNAPAFLDPNYPTWVPSGSIGEYGFNAESSTPVLSPATTRDFMSYCDPTWISPYTYENLQFALISASQVSLRPAAASPEVPEVLCEPQDHLYLTFRMYRDGSVELLPSYHLSGPSPAPQIGLSFPVYFELRDAEGRALVFHRCRLDNPNRDSEAPYLQFHEVVPWYPKAQRIVFFRQGEERDTLEIEERPPEEVRIHAREIEDGVMRVEWRAEHPGEYEEEALTYLLRYSNDGGDTWTTIAANLSQNGRVINHDQLPGGERCLFQVVASGGIRTAVAETDPFAVPWEPRQAYILSPKPEAAFVEGEPVTLVGEGASSDFETTNIEDMVWTSSKDGHLGIGYEVITHTLSAGRHKIMLTVPDGLGGESSTSVFFEVTRA